MNAPKLDLTKPMVCRNGDAVRILCTDGPSDKPIVGVYKNDIIQWSCNGAFRTSGNTSGLDLINVPEKRTVWVYEIRHRIPSDGEFYPSYYFARNEWADKNCISRIKVEFESGRKDE